MIRFIENIGDYFSQHFFDEDFPRKVFDRAGYVMKSKNKEGEVTPNHISEINKKITPLRQKYDRFKNDYLSLNRRKDKVKRTHDFHTEVLKVLGYSNGNKEYENPIYLNESEVIPVRCRFHKGDKPFLYVMEMQSMIQEPDTDLEGIYEQVYQKEDWEKVFPESWEEFEFKPDVINEALSELFLLDEDQRPTYVILLAAPKVFLIHYEKWKYDSFLLFDLEELFVESQVSAHRNYLSLFHALLSKKQFISETESILATLEEDAHKAAYGVTQSLKNGVIYAVESLANEAIYNKLQNAKTEEEKAAIEKLMANDTFARELKDECLTLVYRLLFLFYAEAREDLEILPVRDAVYQKGYSLEMLRDLEMVPLTTESSRNGHFFSNSLWKLFEFLRKGEAAFNMQALDSPLFSDKNLPHLSGVQFRNFILQEIILRLSLSERTKKKGRGRISYSNLGINQLGSVYESLLAYSGFFASEPLIEVKKATDKTGKDGTFLVPQSRRDDFEENEILKDPEHPEEDVIIKKGHFVYRLNGRDRKKSASYYTPEVLTQCTVKYTLKNILDDLRKRQEAGEECAKEILSLKILEPAMGAAAFHNEVINQLSVAYLELREHEMVKIGEKRIVPGQYNEEQQKVKAYIASNNVYGVDLNPTAIELGKLSLWLNVIHKDMETPFFGYRLGVGNAVVGAWLKVYDFKDLQFIPLNQKGSKWEPKEWWTKAPKRIKREPSGKYKRKDSEIYHFLLPDKNMVPSAGIKMLRTEFTTEADAVKEWRKEFVKPIRRNEYQQLQKLSEKIDDLFEQHYKFQAQVNVCTRNKINIYGGRDLNEQCELDLQTYGEKEELMQKREKHEAPYFKLKMIMDYWCSLWFWDMRKAADLPTRSEWWQDIALILDIDLNAPESSKTNEVFDQSHQGSLFGEPRQMNLKTYRREEKTEVTLNAINEYANRQGLFGNERLTRVRDYASRYRFFHNELEFFEVFKERGGFDVIVGNPPWVKLQFEEKDIIAEKFPEVVIKKDSASEVRKKQAEFFKDEKLKETYLYDYIETESTSIFLNGRQNYPLLVGQQTNLYKCVLENGLRLTAKKGFLGLLHPEGIYDDPNGQVLREEIYGRLKYHFQFKNELMLFSEIDHHNSYGTHVYSGSKSEINFININNLFHPVTIGNSFIHSGSGLCGGYKVFNNKTKKFNWNTESHQDRIVKITEKELRVLARAFENSDNWKSAKLVSIHSRQIISVLEKLSLFPTKVEDFRSMTSEGWHETNAQDKGIIKRVHPTEFPNIEEYEMIYSGPHFFVSNPMYKTPRKVCTLNSHYDVIDLTKINENYIARTNYKPAEDLQTFASRINGLKIIGTDKDGKDLYDNWIDYSKIAFSKMLSIAGERTLQPTILPSKISHTNGVTSIIFKDEKHLIELAGICSSVLLDFYVKTVGRSNLYGEAIQDFVLGIDEVFESSLRSRTLMLNCLNSNYTELWKNHFSDSFKVQNWSKSDERLSKFNRLKETWDWNSPIRNFYERRQALVEIDVIVSMALGLTLEELILIYNVQFPVLQQNENDTWYDQEGNIVFTCSKGLIGVGVDRKKWNEIKDFEAGHTYEHIMINELYKGEVITYVAPFEKCDRVEDYKTAWAYFEKVFESEKE